MLEIVITQDGSPTLFDPLVQSHYHSLFGAISESKHVFIHGSQLFERLKQGDVSILEIGFGSGLNFLLSYNQVVDTTLSYVAFEPNLLSEVTFERYYSYLPELFPKATAFFGAKRSTDFPIVFAEFLPKSSLTIYSELFSEQLIINQRFDCIFLDAFDSKKSPELWSEKSFLSYYKLLKPSGCIVSYGITGSVQRFLRNNCIPFEKPRGFANKREMLIVRKLI